MTNPPPNLQMPFQGPANPGIVQMYAAQNAGNVGGAEPMVQQPVSPQGSSTLTPDQLQAILMQQGNAQLTGVQST